MRKSNTLSSGDDTHVVVIATMCSDRSRVASDRNLAAVILKPLVLTATIPVLAAAGLFGCQSAPEKADATEVAMAATSESDSTQTIAPDIVVAVPTISEQAIATHATTAATPKSEVIEPIAPDSVKMAAAVREPANAAEVTTAAEPKSNLPQTTLSDNAETAAKAAFEKNKCGACHTVGTFAATDGASKKRDLSSVGLTRSEVWISGWLQKNETIDGKRHMKTFSGTDAELAALSRWLASQQSKL